MFAFNGCKRETICSVHAADSTGLALSPKLCAVNLGSCWTARQCRASHPVAIFAEHYSAWTLCTSQPRASMRNASGQARSNADSELGGWCLDAASAAFMASKCRAAAAPCSSTSGWRRTSLTSALGKRSPARRSRSACPRWTLVQGLGCNWYKCEDLGGAFSVRTRARPVPRAHTRPMRRRTPMPLPAGPPRACWLVSKTTKNFTNDFAWRSISGRSTQGKASR